MKHFYELWYRFLYCSLGILCCAIILSTYQRSYLLLLLSCFQEICLNSPFVFPRLQDGFILTITLPFFLAFLLYYPFALYSSWTFVVPGFHANERNVYTRICTWTLLFQGSLFWWWLTFGYRFVWELFLKYTIHPGYVFQPHILPFFTFQMQCFVFLFFLGAFPVFFYQFLVFCKISSEYLAQWRLLFYAIFCLFNAWITPGEFFLQFLGTFFCAICFEVTLCCLIFFQDTGLNSYVKRSN